MLKTIRLYEQTLKLAREIGDSRGEAAALGNLGIAYKDLGDVHKASVISLFLISITKKGAVPC